MIVITRTYRHFNHLIPASSMKAAALQYNHDLAASDKFKGGKNDCDHSPMRLWRMLMREFSVNCADVVERWAASSTLSQNKPLIVFLTTSLLSNIFLRVRAVHLSRRDGWSFWTKHKNWRKILQCSESFDGCPLGCHALLDRLSIRDCNLTAQNVLFNITWPKTEPGRLKRFRKFAFQGKIWIKMTQCEQSSVMLCFLQNETNIQCRNLQSDSENWHHRALHRYLTLVDSSCQHTVFMRLITSYTWQCYDRVCEVLTFFSFRNRSEGVGSSARLRLTAVKLLSNGQIAKEQTNQSLVQLRCCEQY